MTSKYFFKKQVNKKQVLYLITIIIDEKDKCGIWLFIYNDII